METEAGELDPQDHLRQLDEAATAARHDAHQRTPLWFWPAFALLAPLVVTLRSTDGGVRLALSVAFGLPVIVAFVVVWKQGRVMQSRGRSGFNQGPGLVWKFFGLFFCITGLQMSLSLLSVDEPIRTGVFTYLFIAIPTTFCFWTFDEKQRQSSTLYGKPR